MAISRLNFIKHILNFPLLFKKFIALSIDMSLCLLAIWLAFYLRLGQVVNLPEISFSLIMFSTFTASLVFITSGLYQEIFRFSGMKALVHVSSSVLIYGFIFAVLVIFVGFDGVPRTIGLLQPLLFLILISFSRLLMRQLLSYRNGLKNKEQKRSFIYGAGAAGQQLRNAMENSTENKVIGYLDDDRRLQGRLINGIPILDPSDLINLVSSYQIDAVYLAMPQITRKRRNEILESMKEARVFVQTLPSLADLAKGKVTFSDIRELDINELLGRDSVKPEEFLLEKLITNKTVLVTGAGGSIGSELCRQIISLNPKKLLLLEHNEFALYGIHQELDSKENPAELIPLLASVQDEARLTEIMSTWKPQTVYHAAAYKHVPLVEHNMSEGVKNNVFGTLFLARAALLHSTHNFVLVSTDKAVRPTNIMGASKRLAEMILQALAANDTSVNFSIVRFGNVLGSSGSVVPKFRQQIKNGGPVTITHPDINRFFMTIPEAAQLVIQAGAMSNGGDVFVLDMGKPVKIIELAHQMIKLSGLTIKDNTYPDGDIEIKVIGLRPGEKLFEELLIGDNPQDTSHSRIMRANEHFIKWQQLKVDLDELVVRLNNNDLDEVHKLIMKLVQEYVPEKKIVDWVYLNR